MNYSHMQHDSFVCMPWLVSWCAVTYSQSTLRWARQKNVCATWLIHKCDVTQLYVTHSQSTYCWARPTLWLCEQFVCVTWLFFTRSMTHSHCDTTHSYVNHDSFACVPWLTCRLRIVGRDQYLVCATLLIHTCDVTHLYVCRDSLAGYTSLSETNNSCVWQDSFVRVPWLIRTCAVACSQATHRWARPTTHVCDKTHSYVCHDSFVRVLWLARRLHIVGRDQQLMSQSSTQATQRHLPPRPHSLPHELGTAPRAQIARWRRHRYVCRDSCVCVPWCMHMCAIYVCHDAFVCVPWFICLPAYTFYLTNSEQHLERKSFVDDKIGTCAMTHVYVCHDSFVRLPWRIYMCAMTHLPPRLHSLSHELRAPLRI